MESAGIKDVLTKSLGSSNATQRRARRRWRACRNCAIRRKSSARRRASVTAAGSRDGRGVVMAKIKVTWERSGINQKEDQKRTIRALGLRKLGQTVEHDDNRTIRGMVTEGAPPGHGAGGRLDAAARTSAAEGRDAQAQARRSWQRQRPRHVRDARHEGPEGPIGRRRPCRASRADNCHSCAGWRTSADSATRSASTTRK